MNALTFARLEHRIRPILARILPASAFIKLYSSRRAGFLERLAETRVDAERAERPVVVCGLRFRNDLGNAAGLDKDGELLPFNYLMGAGFAVVGTVLSSPNKGYNLWTPLPRSRSAINTLGLPSHGVDYAVDNIIEFREAFKPVDFPIGASVMAHPKHVGPREKLEGIVYCLEKLLPVVDFIEVNESCPNTTHNNSDLELRLSTVLNVRDVYKSNNGRYVPVFVKMREVESPRVTVEFIERLDADGVILTNTQVDYDDARKRLDSQDSRLFEKYLKMSGMITEGVSKGGVSGPLIKDKAFSQVSAVSSAIDEQNAHLHVIHVGGIETFEDMERSRALPRVSLREWYTGFMTALGAMPPEKVYKNIIKGS